MSDLNDMSGDIASQIALISRGADEILPAQQWQEKLKLARPLRVKVGFDPTAPDLHLGHTVLMQKMRHFQECGHTVIFLIGDFTATIGDPSGRDATRPPLSADAIAANAATYAEQVFKVLDPDKTEVRRNSEWFGNMPAAELIRLASHYTVARMLERNDFAARYANNRSIAIHEFLYPLVQAYDSVALNADFELGGSDQKFNLLVGRELQRQLDGGQTDGQCILTVPLLEGTDGKKKMSKSLGNQIGLEDHPNDFYGKLMSISDALMWRYYQLLSAQSAKAIAQMQDATDAGENPMQYKRALALELTSRFCGASAGQAASDHFDQCIVGKQLPDEIPTLAVQTGEDGKIPPLYYLLKSLQLVASSSEAKRLIQQRAVKIDDATITNPDHTLAPGGTFIVRIGKRRTIRLRTPT